MSEKLYSLFKNIAFQLDPETVHDLVMKLNSLAPKTMSMLTGSVKDQKKYHIKSNHLNWRFPVGIAAGLDKNAIALKFFESLGFGNLEYGTITPILQAGNPKPRIHRYPTINSLRNSMGFPNVGSSSILKNIQQYKRSNELFCLGANIGKNKWSDGEKVFHDYQILYKEFAPYADYVAINVSSPNTPGLRNLQSPEFMAKILQAIKIEKDQYKKPVFVKLAPDLSKENIQDTLKVCLDHGVEGIIATNTTNQHQLGSGGLSGAYLKQISKNIRSIILSEIKGTNLDLIGVGGIDSTQDLIDFWNAGGKLAQIYTSFIYQGPQVLVQMKSDIDHLLKKYQVDTLQELLDSSTNISL